MPSNKDIKALIQARTEQRRAIAQTDPAEVVAQPEPELAGPPAAPPTRPDPEPALSVSVSPESAAPVANERKDARYLPAPVDDIYVAKTYRLKRHRHQQLKDEAYHRDMQIQDILDTALAEYFQKRYGAPKDPT